MKIGNWELRTEDWGLRTFTLWDLKILKNWERKDACQLVVPSVYLYIFAVFLCFLARIWMFYHHEDLHRAMLIFLSFHLLTEADWFQHFKCGSNVDNMFSQKLYHFFGMGGSLGWVKFKAPYSAKNCIIFFAALSPYLVDHGCYMHTSYLSLTPLTALV